MLLTDYIHHCPNAIPVDICDRVVNEVERDPNKWVRGAWYGYRKQEIKSNDHLRYSGVLNLKFMDYVYKQIPILREQGHVIPLDFHSQPRVNKYETGHRMAVHYDHIHDIFDGMKKGIPVMTTIGNLNDDYEGGKLVICGQEIPLKKGDVIFFPSVYLYPHEVTEITKGTRYSWICWWF